MAMRDRFGAMVAMGVVTGLLVAPVAVKAATLSITDITVDSSNETGHYYGGWFYNTQGLPANTNNQWNLYVATGTPATPAFVNTGNTDATTRVDIDLQPGLYQFVLFAESIPAWLTLPEVNGQHWALNLYFNGNQAAPGITGVFGPQCPALCAGTSWNGRNVWGEAPMQQAGTLEFLSGDLRVRLLGFNFGLPVGVAPFDQVGPYATVPSGVGDYLGAMTIEVTRVPEPTTFGLLGLALVALARRRR
jgi:hypothetical protein